MKRHRIVFAILPICVVLSSCASRPAPQSAPQTELRNLGRHSWKITTRSPETQRAFDRGLTLAYAFAHFAAEQEFRRAAQADPSCAMAWWGVALVNGPHINFPAVPPDHAATAWEALTKAKTLSANASPLERALIQALAQRYQDPQPEDRSALDAAYAQALRQVYVDHPEHADVAVLCAEALMDLHPWDLWTNTGPQAWTPEIISVLEHALELDPEHPGANHLYIHALEASANSAKAVPAADRLQKLVPDAGHLVHMSAHIYARVGRWEDASEANRKAMRCDAAYRAVYPRPGFYAMYMAHNAHFLAFASMMQGRSEEALQCARKMVAGVPEEFLKDYAFIADGYMIFVSEVLMRFGRWKEVLAEPPPRPELPLSGALWHFTRASAFTALNRLEDARVEKEAFEKGRVAVPQNWNFGNNSAAEILAIAGLVLEGEMSARTGDIEAALSSLRKAVALEDKLRYDEPPDWIQPVRHTLGAVLLKAGRAAEAEVVYREDLERYAENGWSLMGLRDALQTQNKTKEAATVNLRFRKIWARADVQPTATCYCHAP